MKKIKGVSMIEVLVTIVITSIGLLGLVALQGQGIKNNHTSDLRTKAISLIQDIADSMRANRSAALAGNYNVHTGNLAAVVETANCRTTAGCTAQQLALDDITLWARKVQNELPLPDPANALPLNLGWQICYNNDYTDDGSCNNSVPGTGPIYAIEVSWSEKNQQQRSIRTGAATDRATETVIVDQSYAIKVIP